MTTLIDRFDFDRQVSLSESLHHKANIASNDAFVLAMASAVRRRKEKVIPGTFVDTTPNLFARRF
jgi:hypothetical protein